VKQDGNVAERRDDPVETLSMLRQRPVPLGIGDATFAIQLQQRTGRIIIAYQRKRATQASRCNAAASGVERFPGPLFVFGVDIEIFQFACLCFTRLIFSQELISGRN